MTDVARIIQTGPTNSAPLKSLLFDDHGVGIATRQLADALQIAADIDRRCVAADHNLHEPAAVRPAIAFDVCAPVAKDAESVETFFLRDANARITFTKSPSGDVTGLVLDQGGRQVPARKVR